MVTIPQHGENGELYDLKAFVYDLAPFLSFESWSVRVDQCAGNAALAIEELTSSMPTISQQAFESLAVAIHQTIDGEFIAYRDNKEILRLVAVDSSFWEISGNEKIEKMMLEKYGAYGN
ncbi:MAG: hypothetical protein EAZ37_03740 [Burkholderiales bacterium]|nr:MAG: hypothetical protein EAZ37_03740 [Burkholderiales bacterium]